MAAQCSPHFSYPPWSASRPGGRSVRSGPISVSRATVEARDAAEAAFDLYVETRLYAKSQVHDDILRSRLGLFGSVERVADQLRELRDMGVDHIVFMINFGGLSAEKVHRSMRLIAEEVAPRVNADMALSA